MKSIQGHVWLAGLGLALALAMLMPGQGAPDGMAVGEHDFQVTDYGLFFEELHAAGALKFFENTEDLLRIAEFERALLRYRFLKGQIARNPGYRPLVSMINRRLAFLAHQLRLAEEDLAPLLPPRVRRSRPSPRAAAPTPEKPAPSIQPEAEAPPAPETPETGQADFPVTEMPPALPAAPTDGEPLIGEASPGPLTPEPPLVQEPETETPPPPPPSRWQRFKEWVRSWRK